jgi:hypothetical protein
MAPLAPTARTVARWPGDVAPQWRGLWEDLYGVVVFDGPVPTLHRPGQAPLSATVLRGAPVRSWSAAGRTWRYDGTDDCHQFDVNIPSGQGLASGAFTVLLHLRPISSSTNAVYFEVLGGNCQVRRRYISSSDRVGLYMNSATAGNSGVAANDNRDHAILFSHAGSTAYAESWTDGTLRATYAPSRGGGAVTKLTIGDANTTVDAADCALSFVALWNRALSPGEAALVTNHPFAPFTRHRRRVVAAPATASPGFFARRWR